MIIRKQKFYSGVPLKSQRTSTLPYLKNVTHGSGSVAEGDEETDAFFEEVTKPNDEESQYTKYNEKKQDTDFTEKGRYRRWNLEHTRELDVHTIEIEATINQVENHFHDYISVLHTLRLKMLQKVDEIWLLKNEIARLKGDIPEYMEKEPWIPPFLVPYFLLGGLIFFSALIFALIFYLWPK